MKLSFALPLLIAMAAASLLLAIGAYYGAVRAADASAVSSTHLVLSGAARRIAQSYANQVLSVRDELHGSLSRNELDAFGRRVVTATIGDNEGIDGGWFLFGSGLIADGPQRVAGRLERQTIDKLAAQVRLSHRADRDAYVTRDGDLIAIDVYPLVDSSGVAFARERIPASILQGARSSFPLIVAAILCSAVLLAVSLYIVWQAKRSVRYVLDTIATLEREPRADIAQPRGDFGPIVGALTGMSHRRAEAEWRARVSERLAAIGKMAANAAHEIRNPLNSLRLQITLANRRIGASFDKSAAGLNAEIERLDAVVRTMLEMERQPEPRDGVDLRAVIRKATETLRQKALATNRTIKIDPGEGSLTVIGDSDKLVQLVINLVDNALDAAPTGSAVEVRLLPGPQIHVSDAGAIADSVDLSQLFEPFYTTKPDGTGLGLSIVYEIARHHGARIEVRKAIDRTVFVVDFSEVAA